MDLVTDESCSPYILPWDESEKERMVIQEKFFFDCIYGGQYIPRDIKFSPTTHILDSGTGTGDYLVGVAKQVQESFQFSGVDIRESLFRSDMPPNAHLTISSVTSLPQEWGERFDFVHQRLMLPALLAVDWPKAISEIYRVTKPGGSAQFIELSPDWPKGKGMKANEKVRELVAALQDKRGLMFDCAHHLERMMEASGFINVTVTVKNAPLGIRSGAIGEIGARNHGSALRNMKAAMLKDGFVKSGEEYDALIDSVVREWHAGEDVHFKFYVALGIKL